MKGTVQLIVHGVTQDRVAMPVVEALSETLREQGFETVGRPEFGDMVFGNLRFIKITFRPAKTRAVEL